MKVLSLRLTLALIIGLLSAGTAFAEENFAGSEILTAIAITAGAPLEFGRIVAGPGGTVTINAQTGGRTSSGVTLLSTGNTAAAATFVVTGTEGKAYVITLPADGVVTIDLDDDSDSMDVDTFTSYPSGAVTNPTLGAGPNDLNVGAKLHVASDQADGDYTGSFLVTVDYE